MNHEGECAQGKQCRTVSVATDVLGQHVRHLSKLLSPPWHSLNVPCVRQVLLQCDDRFQHTAVPCTWTCWLCQAPHSIKQCCPLLLLLVVVCAGLDMETVERSMIDFGEDCLKNGTRYRCATELDTDCVPVSGGWSS